MSTTTVTTDVNEVHLRGRLSGVPEARELPSGDVLWSFRVVVSRPPGERTKVDAIDCVTSNSRLVRSLQGCPEGAVLEVDGRLQRRFWRGPTGVNSRYEVAVAAGRVRSRPRTAA